MEMKLSLIIPCLDLNDKKLKELLRSIDAQDFPKNEMEVLVISDGTSESAKAIGIRKARGEVIGILASDNELDDKRFLAKAMMQIDMGFDATYPLFYSYHKYDDILNRYFSLIGGNDVLSFYLCKNDRGSKLDKSIVNVMDRETNRLTYGDNGFFIRKKKIMNSDMNNYYHIDNVHDVNPSICYFYGSIWHKTGGNILAFFAKRYQYGLQHAFNKNRRWHLVDFSQPQDIRRLLWFIFVSLTVIQPLCLSIRGYLKVRDVAWFLHPIVCLMTLFTYGFLVLNLGIKQLSQSLFAPMEGLKA